MKTVKNTVVIAELKLGRYGILENGVLVVPCTHVSELEAFKEWFFFISDNNKKASYRKYLNEDCDNEFLIHYSQHLLSLMDLPKVSD